MRIVGTVPCREGSELLHSDKEVHAQSKTLISDQFFLFVFFVTSLTLIKDEGSDAVSSPDPSHLCLGLDAILICG